MESWCAGACKSHVSGKKYTSSTLKPQASHSRRCPTLRCWAMPVWLRTEAGSPACSGWHSTMCALPLLRLSCRQCSCARTPQDLKCLTKLCVTQEMLEYVLWQHGVHYKPAGYTCVQVPHCARHLAAQGFCTLRMQEPRYAPHLAAQGFCTLCAATASVEQCSAGCRFQLSSQTSMKRQHCLRARRRLLQVCSAASRKSILSGPH